MFGLKKKSSEQKITLKLLSTDLVSEFDKKIKQQQDSSNLKGYRKGKAPKEVIEQLYGEQITGQVIYEGMTNAFYKKVSEEKISVVGQPALNPKNMDITKDVSFEVVFEIYPEFTLKKFSAIKFKQPKASISDKDIDETIEKMQKRFGNLEKIEGYAETENSQKLTLKDTWMESFLKEVHQKTTL